MSPDFHTSIDLHVLPDAAELAATVGAEIAVFLRERSTECRKDFPVEVAISGGFTTTALLPALLAYVEDIDWSCVRFWWVDERFVPAGHPDRNDEAAIASVLSHLPGVQWVSMPCDEGQGLERARQACEEQWHALMGNRSLDLSVLGMGPDGHVASLFPGDAWLTLGDSSPAVIAIDDSPKPPPQRLSLSMPVIQASDRIILATGGEAKAEAIAAILGGTQRDGYPASALFDPRCTSRVTVYVDVAAASLLE